MANSDNVIWQISTWSIVKIVLIGVALWVLYLIRDVIGILFVSLILASALESWVNWLNKRRIPRLAAVLLLYIVILALVSALFATLYPVVAQQVRSLASYLPQALQHVVDSVEAMPSGNGRFFAGDDLSKFLSTLSDSFVPQAGGVFSFLFTFFGGVFSFILILVITLYIVVQQDAIKATVQQLVPEPYHLRVSNTIERVQTKIGSWLRGIIILSVIIGTFAYVGLLIIDVPNALALALLAGFTEIIPVLGPIISCIPAVILTLAVSPFKALLVILLYILIHQLENNLIVPQVMRKAVGLNPLVSILAVLIGQRLLGIAGVLLAIPVATAITVILEEIFPHTK